MNAIEMKNITMAFGNFKAVDDVSLVVKKNEIHALIGENGAGKSTLMSVLFGLYRQNAGTISVNDGFVQINSPLDANKLGIGMVHQHFKLVADFTVLENIVLNVEQQVFKLFVSYQEAKTKIKEIMNKYNLQIKLNKKIANCTVAEQQRVEILKMLYRDANILIFDEPTAVLAPAQIKQFLKALLDLQKKGKTIIIISHKLDELKQVATKGTVIRKGRLIGEVDVKKITNKALAKMMVGADVSAPTNVGLPVTSANTLQIVNLTVPKYGVKGAIGLRDFSLEVKAGEIVAIAGVEGNGQTELVNVLTGLQHPQGGRINLQVTTGIKTDDKTFKAWHLAWKDLSIKQKRTAAQQAQMDKLMKQITTFVKQLPTKNIVKNYWLWKAKIDDQMARIKNHSSKRYGKLKAQLETTFPISKMINFSRLSIKQKYDYGMAHIPEDRQKHGMVLEMNLQDNTIIQHCSRRPYARYGWLDRSHINRQAEDIVKQFDVRTSGGVKSIAGSLSGGNQQKFVVGREMIRDAALIVIAQPTRGLDVGAIENIHNFVIKAKTQACPIVLVSYELSEVFSLADRIVVLNGGKNIGDVPKRKTSIKQLGAMMTQQKEVVREQKASA